MKSRARRSVSAVCACNRAGSSASPTRDRKQARGDAQHEPRAHDAVVPAVPRLAICSRLAAAEGERPADHLRCREHGDQLPATRGAEGTGDQDTGDEIRGQGEAAENHRHHTLAREAHSPLGGRSLADRRLRLVYSKPSQEQRPDQDGHPGDVDRA